MWPSWPCCGAGADDAERGRCLAGSISSRRMGFSLGNGPRSGSSGFRDMVVRYVPVIHVSVRYTGTNNIAIQATRLGKGTSAEETTYKAQAKKAWFFEQKRGLEQPRVCESAGKSGSKCRKENVLCDSSWGQQANKSKTITAKKLALCNERQHGLSRVERRKKKKRCKREMMSKD